MCSDSREVKSEQCNYDTSSVVFNDSNLVSTQSDVFDRSCNVPVSQSCSVVGHKDSSPVISMSADGKSHCNEVVSEDSIARDIKDVISINVVNLTPELNPVVGLGGFKVS